MEDIKEKKSNLIPLGQPGNEAYDKMIRSKLKGSGSDKRKFAQKLKAIRGGEVNEDKIDSKLLALVTDPQASALQLQEITNIMIKRGIADSKLADFVSVVRAANDTHAKIHGSKAEIKADIKTNFDDMLERFEAHKAEIVLEDVDNE